MPKMTGSRLFAEMMKGYGVTHVFFVPTILDEALAEMEDLGLTAGHDARRESRGLHGGRLRARPRAARACAWRSRSARRISRPGCAMHSWRARR